MPPFHDTDTFLGKIVSIINNASPPPMKTNEPKLPLCYAVVLRCYGLPPEMVGDITGVSAIKWFVDELPKLM